jgi:uncharacterized MAPEG superfamily protein
VVVRPPSKPSPSLYQTNQPYSGIDNNVSPRHDLSSYGDAAIKSGKITPSQLKLMQRATSAHQNRVENFSIFGSAVVLAVAVGVPNSTVNGYCALYSVASVLYGVAYVVIERNPWSLARTCCWWAGCWACGRLFWEAGRVVNG